MCMTENVKLALQWKSPRFKQGLLMEHLAMVCGSQSSALGHLLWEVNRSRGKDTGALSSVRPQDCPHVGTGTGTG